MKLTKLKFLFRFIFCGFLILISSCSDFVERPPLDRISESQYWKSPEDAKIYVNSLYLELGKLDGGFFGVPYQDKDSDNALYGNYSKRLAGSRIVPSSGGEWTKAWDEIREVNYFLKNYDKIEDSFDSYKQYVGEAHFFRAYFYFNLVKSYGDIPYITKPLHMDSEELYKPSLPRQQVIDSTIADLNKAIEYMTSGPNQGGTRLNKEIAQLFKSRVCLYEGTWEKYQKGTAFGVSEPKVNQYLQLAVEAAEGVVKSGHYSVYSTGDPGHDYFNLFNHLDYSENPEIMLWIKYDSDMDMIHAHQNALVLGGGNRGATKSLVDAYLCADGLPIATSPLYQDDTTMSAVQANRDLRLDQTIWGPGEPQKMLGRDTLKTWSRAPILRGGSGGLSRTIGGYHIKKGAQPDRSKFVGGNKSEVGTPIFRYAEVLLNYAEAKTELGTITQKDVNMTINKLRDRVNMTHLIIGNIPTDSNWLFPNLSPLLNEIRRERRVELALEGHRWDDLARWRAHEVFVGKRPRGAFFEPNRYPDLDIGKDVYIDSEGYIDPYQKSLPEGTYNFDPGRDYLDPLPTDQFTLNKHLEQNPGW